MYVAYGLSNYLWWRSLGNESDDNGVLTLTFASDGRDRRSFAAAHLDDTGVPVPATGAEKVRIDADWEAARECAGLGATPPDGPASRPVGTDQMRRRERVSRWFGRGGR